jgi:ADP-ribose pyrophosphatase YjhB (NUDIX family)
MPGGTVRHVARTVVLDSAGAVLLLRYEDQSVSYWVPPGGALRAGEWHAAAAQRELAEETSLHAEIGPALWIRRFVMPFERRLVDQEERYFVVRLSVARPPVANQTPDEAIVEARWWTLDELRRSDALFFPDGFVDLVAPVMLGVIPKTPLEI